MKDARTLLLCFSLKYKGNWQEIYDAILNKEEINVSQYEEQIKKLKCNFTTILDPGYPQVLKDIYRPPFVIYYYGNFGLLNSIGNNIAVVGSRNPSYYGEKITKSIVKDLSKKFTIVSGMAKGIDSISHKACIENGGSTIAILGSGIDMCYPSENIELYNTLKESHLILSEYPGITPPNKDNFPLRNRIIAGLSKSLLITEAKTQSGTSITAHYALDFGRMIMAVPAMAGEHSACNELIRAGAILVENSDQVIEEMKGYPYFEKNS